MVKKKLELWLDEEDIKRIILKAKECGYEGKGATSHYIEKIAKEPIVFLGSDVKAILKALNFLK
jgi:phosphoribosylaminoimidazole carboxylase (NCAIR synthetase)